jgi:hypothetical protein
MDKNISKQYGIDIADQLSAMLSEELTKQIDMDILRGLGLEADKFKRRKKKIENILKSFE